MAAEPHESNPSMLLAALTYARTLGWRVFPTHHPVFSGAGVACSCSKGAECKNIGKHPRTDNGVKDATADEATITKWWKQWPTANIAVAAGDSFWVLDVDPGKGGDAALATLEEKHGALPRTVEAVTGSGGRHLLFTAPAGITVRNRVGFVRGLDTRSTGGYIVVSPSLHTSGRRYAWQAAADDTPIAPAPMWLLELVLGAPEKEHRPAPASAIPDLNRRYDRARKYLARIPGAVSGEGGHLQTWMAAIALVRGFDLPQHAALELLAAEYNHRCQPRWSLKELEHKVKTASQDARRPLGYLLTERDDSYIPSQSQSVRYDANDDGGNDDERDAIEQEPSLPQWLTPSERARRIGGVTAKLPTGFETLDKATRGGPRAGKVIVFGGAPGAGKTTFVVQLARIYAKQGLAVAILAADEDADGLLIRWGQSEGIERELLENGEESARDLLARLLGELPNLLLVDADEVEATVEDVADRLHRLAQDAGVSSVLILDSLQTLRTRKSTDAEDRRDRVDEVVATLKRCAKEHGHLVLVTCELSRGAYRSQNAADRIDDLAAFKESGGIEYGVTTALVLRSVRGEEDLVDVTMPKNRLGQKLPFRLKLNFRLAEFEEVPMPEEESGDDAIDEEIERARKARERVLAAVRTTPGLRSRNDVSRRAGGRKQDNLAAVDDLIEMGELSKVGGCFQVSSGSGLEAE